MLKKVLYFTIVFLIFLFVLKIFRDSSWSKIDVCLDKGGCWDYIRNRCEIDNQDYCVKNSSDYEKI